MEPCRLCLYELGTNVYCSVCAAHDCAPAQEEKEMDTSACAAGPWRYDVENAPKDGSEVWLYWHNPGDPECKRTTTASWSIDLWSGHMHYVLDSWLIAFAIPNLPQVKP